MSETSLAVSIIMACHNSAAYLNDAVYSVLHQTFCDWELILVDDASTDGTLEIARQHERTDDRVIVIALPTNGGPARARNRGMHVARGVWLGILDSDDIAMPSRLHEQLQRAKRDTDVVLVGSDAVTIDESGVIEREHRYPSEGGTLAKRLYAFQPFPPHSSMLYRADAVRRIGFYNPRYMLGEDYDLWLRLSEVGKLASVQAPLVKIRMRDLGISNWHHGLALPRLSRAAGICHYLRMDHHVDPSADREEVWQDFLAWVDARLAVDGVLERHRAWITARRASSMETGWTRAVRLAGALLRSGHAPALVWERLFGSSLPQRLAAEWMQRAGQVLTSAT